MFGEGIDNSIEITDAQLLHKYFNITSLPVMINSPFRVDENPSFRISEYNGKIYYYDFGNKERGTIINMLSRLWNCSYHDVLKKITNDSFTPITLKQNKTSNFDIKVRFRAFKSYDIEYWNSFGISEKFLKFGDVYAISHFFISDGDLHITINADKYAYVYLEYKDNICTYKIYQPFSKTYKWLSNRDSSIWELWNKLPASDDKLIITSSRKDALCLWENIQIPSLCLLSEPTLPKEHVINLLKKRFKDIFVLYDNDFTKTINEGREYGNKIATLFNLKQIEIPTILQSKDPSDLFKNKGKQIFKQTLNNLIN